VSDVHFGLDTSIDRAPRIYFDIKGDNLHPGYKVNITSTTVSGRTWDGRIEQQLHGTPWYRAWVKYTGDVTLDGALLFSGTDTVDVTVTSDPATTTPPSGTSPDTSVDVYSSE
jgi:hypothetical protein